MADLAGAQMIGDSIVALLKARRSLLSQQGLLGPVPPASDIAHVPVTKLITPPAPTAGLTLTCIQLVRSDHARSSPAAAGQQAAIGISLELRFLLACWAGTAADELALMSWAMLELSRYPTLDSAQLLGTGWARDEAIQLSPEEPEIDTLLRLWDGCGLKYHLSTTLRARVLRIGYGPEADGPPVVASRFSFAHGDATREPSL